MSEQGRESEISSYPHFRLRSQKLAELTKLLYEQNNSQTRKPRGQREYENYGVGPIEGD